MNFMADALANAAVAKARPEHELKEGDRVTVRNREYAGEEGEVVGFETNFFNCPLVEVRLDNGGKTVFYPHELEKHAATEDPTA